MNFDKINNSIKIQNIINDLKIKKIKIVPNICPDKITLDMLKIEMDCADLRGTKNINIKTLWHAYYINNFKINKFGFYVELNEIINNKTKIPNIKELTDNINNPKQKFSLEDNPLFKNFSKI